MVATPYSCSVTSCSVNILEIGEESISQCKSTDKARLDAYRIQLFIHVKTPNNLL